MIVFQVELDPGFRKGDMNNIPSVSSEMVCAFVTRAAGADPNNANSAAAGGEAKSTKDEAELKVDYIQVRRVAEICEVRAVVFPADLASSATISADSLARVTIKVNTKKEDIPETVCERCAPQISCRHILACVFWLHRKSNDAEAPAIRDFWGTETESLAEAEPLPECLRVRDLFVCDELRLETDIEAATLSEQDGQVFIEAVLNEMDEMGLRSAALYKHCRPGYDECEPLYIHHAMLDALSNGVRDVRSFVQHMEDQARLGLFDRLAELSKTSYKTPLWLEAQYMRLRCSLIHRITSRKDSAEDEQLLEMLFCKDRDANTDERQQLKQHKRFILKQTEKLENKTYQECGLLLSESYPYICAAPDGITDDHIVEIKVPKTDEEFEKYLEGRETIAPKYMAQIQIQMYMANVTKALYCVLSPTFDTNGALHYVWVQADMEFVASLLGAAEDFWKDVVFPRLAKIYLSGH